jgi:hypothetical protein
MLVKKAYLERVVDEVEDLAARIALLKTRLAKQSIGVKMEAYWELEYLRNRFAEFKRRVEELEDATDERLDEAEAAVETVWKDVKNTLDSLLEALS